MAGDSPAVSPRVSISSRTPSNAPKESPRMTVPAARARTSPNSEAFFFTTTAHRAAATATAAIFTISGMARHSPNRFFTRLNRSLIS